MFDFLLRNWEIIAGMLGAVITWFASWKLQKRQSKVAMEKQSAELKAELEKKSAELETVKADGAKKLVDLYQEVLNDLKARYEQRFEDLHQEISELRKSVDLWKTKYRALKKEFELYRASNNKTPSDGN